MYSGQVAGDGKQRHQVLVSGKNLKSTIGLMYGKDNGFHGD